MQTQMLVLARNKVPTAHELTQVWLAIWEAEREKRAYTMLHPDYLFDGSKY